jgi:hypothetical protein
MKENLQSAVEVLSLNRAVLRMTDPLGAVCDQPICLPLASCMTVFCVQLHCLSIVDPNEPFPEDPGPTLP